MTWAEFEDILPGTKLKIVSDLSNHGLAKGHIVTASFYDEEYSSLEVITFFGDKRFLTSSGDVEIFQS